MSIRKYALIAALALATATAPLSATPAAADPPGCPNDKVCTWLLPNFTGDRKEFADPPALVALGDHAHLVDSWHNADNGTWCLVETVEGDVPIILECLGSGQSNSNVNPIVTLLADALLKL